jgi:hypothetical protein
LKTGDGRNEDAGGATRDEENVIRLPRDWLGPPEELVPIGPAARARAAQLEADDAAPPAADAFWSEDSAALHDAVQAPPGGVQEPLGPPAGLVDPDASQLRLRAGGLARLGGVPRMRMRWAAIAVPTVLLLVLAAIGFGEQGGTGVTGGHGKTSQPLERATSTPTGTRPGPESYAALDSASVAKSAAVTARYHSPHAAGRAHTRAAKRARTHARARNKAAGTAGVRRRASPARQSTVAPAVVVTEASPPPPTSPATTSTPMGTATPASGTASKSSSGGSSSAPPPGPTQIGTMSGGCTVKCS